MQVQENSCMKCAGVAGLRERATGLNGANRTILDEPARSGGGQISLLWGTGGTQGSRAKSGGPVQSDAAESITGA